MRRTSGPAGGDWGRSGGGNKLQCSTGTGPYVPTAEGGVSRGRYALPQPPVGLVGQGHHENPDFDINVKE